jgi:hypothetical protein
LVKEVIREGEGEGEGKNLKGDGRSIGKKEEKREGAAGLGAS